MLIVWYREAKGCPLSQSLNRASCLFLASVSELLGAPGRFVTIGGFGVVTASVACVEARGVSSRFIAVAYLACNRTLPPRFRL
jgi:hypothetical protein